MGAKVHYADTDFDFQLASISAAALLVGRLPNPTFLTGNVHVNYDFLRVFKGSFEFNFRSGSDCNVVIN